MNQTNHNQTNKNNYTLNCIYFYLTEGCNVACRHCWIAPKFETGKTAYPTLRLDLFRSIIAQAKPLGLTAVKLTGGEPLMHPDISDILKHIHNEGLRLTIETNGILCTADLAREIARGKNPFVSVSLDAASAEVHEWVRGVAGSFEAAKEGIKHLVAAGLRPTGLYTSFHYPQGIGRAEVNGESCFCIQTHDLQPLSKDVYKHVA